MVMYEFGSVGSRDESLGVNCHKQGTRHVSDQGVFGGVDGEQQMNVACFVAFFRRRIRRTKAIEAEAE